MMHQTHKILNHSRSITYTACIIEKSKENSYPGNVQYIRNNPCQQCKKTGSDNNMTVEQARNLLTTRKYCSKESDSVSLQALAKALRSLKNKLPAKC